MHELMPAIVAVLSLLIGLGLGWWMGSRMASGLDEAYKSTQNVISTIATAHDNLTFGAGMLMKNSADSVRRSQPVTQEAMDEVPDDHKQAVQLRDELLKAGMLIQSPEGDLEEDFDASEI